MVTTQFFVDATLQSTLRRSCVSAFMKLPHKWNDQFQFSFRKWQFLFSFLSIIRNSDVSSLSLSFSCSLLHRSVGWILIWRITWCNGMWNRMHFTKREMKVERECVCVCLMMIYTCGASNINWELSNPMRKNADRQQMLALVGEKFF